MFPVTTSLITDTMATEIVAKGEGQLQVHFYTKQEPYSIADTPYSIPANVNTDDLSRLVNTIIRETNEAHETDVDFDFIIREEFLRVSLSKHLKEHEISFEDIIEIEYVPRYPPPEPENSLPHDDWVSAVQAGGAKWILTGSYDTTLNIWTTKGEHKLTIPGHTAPVKDVCWISLDAQTGVFASASQDQTAMIWVWSIPKNSVECVHVLSGHERGLECIAASPDRRRLATGSWDMMLKVWSASTEEEPADVRDRKKAKMEESNVRTPQLTVDGHREAISAVKWMDNTTLMTASWDHTMKLWDLSIGGVKDEIPGNKTFFDADYSPLNGMIIAASADKNLRLYDPRVDHSIVVRNIYTGHTQWVQTVSWAPDDEWRFISGAYDNQVKLWDHRSPKAPLFDLIGHEDKVLCCDWTNSKLIMSGGCDNALRIFKSNKAPEAQK